MTAAAAAAGSAPLSSGWIRDLAALTPADARSVGNKALRQGLLLAAGFPVSPGFCVTAAAIAAWREGGEGREAVCAALLAAYRALGGRVAVRSSAIEEDGDGASYAGVYATELGVHGEAALLAALERCIASWAEPAAVEYRARLGHADAALAILVQRLVPAVAAGIAYTRAPLDTRRREVHVDAVWGLAEPLAAGRHAGDSFVLSHAGRLLRKRIGHKREALAVDGPHPVRPQRARVACLTPAETREIALLALRAEAFFGGPQDVEFAVDLCGVWLLQARPLVAASTAGGAGLESYLAGERRRLARKFTELRQRGLLRGSQLVLSNGNVGELLPTPTAMSFGLFRDIFAGRRGAIVTGRRRLGYRFDARCVDHLYELVAGQLCFNLEVDAATFGDGAEPPVDDYLDRVAADPSLANYPEVRLYGRLPLDAPAAAVRERFERGMRAAARDYLARYESQVAPRLGVPAALEQAVASGDPRRVVAAVSDLVRFLRTGPCVEFVIAARLGFHFAAEVRRTLEALFGSDGEALCARLLSGLPGSLITRQALWLEDVAGRRRSRADYLAAYGHCADNELELAEPRLAEDPARLDELLANLRASGRRPAAEFARQQAARHAAEAELGECLAAAGVDEAAHAAVFEALAFAQHFLPLRETIKHHYTAVHALVRRAALHLAAHLDWPEALVFHLHTRELPAALRDPAALRRRAERRAGEHALARLAARLHCVPAVVFGARLDAIGVPTARAGEGGDAGEGSAWSGAPLSAGKVCGVARVFAPGEPVPAEGWRGDEILVLRAANLGVTPLFRIVAGLVVEVGGLLAHSACQAREAGIPAVALPDATRLITDGARIVLDGASGRIALVESSTGSHSDESLHDPAAQRPEQFAPV
ncbi:PEP-utilizing enzyme [Aromatoleum toluolicum]|uniref:Pyruvate phosphate dikinase n=1 Tax=Aromatoleum toluolicum TaxID=90060 RepID=A0ABX1NLH7_9RHOO|nr:PEP/pyruvate-binding domain-containing protein [Aromatoleum toluolicum]NMG00202.1 PEP-utilizing enzyme [Aromatoleum toluolicum]